MHTREATTADIPQIQVVRHLVKENILSDPALVTNEDCQQYIIKKGKGSATLKTVSGGTLTARKQGKKLTLTDQSGGVAYVTIADVNQSNGVIHVIDHVLLPKM